MTKITDFQQCIGKTIQKIEDDDEVIRMTFKDGGFIELVGEQLDSVCLSGRKEKHELNSPFVYENNKPKDENK